MFTVRNRMKKDVRSVWFEERYKRRRPLFILACVVIFSLQSCLTDPVVPDQEETTCGTPYSLKLPNFFPPMPIPSNNPLTLEGIELGRQLFYEPLLSGNNQQTCASCHIQSHAFTDTARFSVGVDGFRGGRNSMPIANLAWSPKLFWDGKAGSLEQQVLFPIQSAVEMHEDIFNAVKELQESPKYPDLFNQAFCDSLITVDRMSRAMAQFMRTIISYNYKMAPGSVGQQSRNPVEERGFQVFIDETKGDCFHCHAVNIFTTNFEFTNNGLFKDNASDPGLFGQTGNPADKGKFKTPSLINLKFTAPYMHDGRFATLRDVINFYDTGFHVTETLDVSLLKHTDVNGKPVPRKWTEQDKTDLIAFLMGLKDDALLTNARWSAP